MSEYKHAVFIGRFQPFHSSHLEVVKHGLEIADKVIILVGSSTAARTFKNPFTYDERYEMILGSLPDGERHRVTIRGIRDYYYNMPAWLASVQAITDELIPHGDSVALLGAFKDASSYYLRCFPQWDHIATKEGPIHATDIRTRLYDGVVNKDGHILTDWEAKLSSPPMLQWLKGIVPLKVERWIQSFAFTPEFAVLAKEWQSNLEYKAKWADAPFPPTFVTADAVVVCSGHVLVVKRKFNPGKGLYALPGGFIRTDEFIRDAALRELKEETGIRVEKIILDSSVVADRVFDHPDRSLRGRTITHAFYIKLKDGELPEVRGNDDAASAVWMPLWDVVVNESKFFEDHAHIIHAFVGAQ